MNPLLEVINLSVTVNNKPILNDITMRLDKADVMVLFGPNGSGKSTLLKTLMGFQGYHIERGEIIFKGEKINQLNIAERVRLGLGIMFQHPPRICGVSLAHLAQIISQDKKEVQELAEKLVLGGLLDRDINVGFSGGEMKRSELFQLLLQKPDLVLLDEPESGVDIENVSLMGRVLNSYLMKTGKAAFMITHTGYILDYVTARKGCVLLNGKFWCVGDPREMFLDIKKFGYEKCTRCECPQKS